MRMLAREQPATHTESIELVRCKMLAGLPLLAPFASSWVELVPFSLDSNCNEQKRLYT